MLKSSHYVFFLALVTTWEIQETAITNALSQKVALLNVNKGNIESNDAVTCDQKVISVTAAKFKTNVSTILKNEKNAEEECKEETLLWEIQGALNYKSSFTTFYVKCLRNEIGNLKIDFKCVNITGECTADCIVDGHTCLSSIEGSRCDCLEVPAKTWSYTVCSGASYIGCFNISVENIPSYRHLNLSLLLTPQICIQACQMMGYQFAILQGLNMGCFCLENINNSLGPVDEGKCLSSCNDNPIYSCGTKKYGHVYKTNIISSNMSCSRGHLCPNGTTCVNIFDSYKCLCDEDGDRPVNCYGCLPGWMSTPYLNNCYAVVNFSKTFEEHSAKCKAIYGAAVDISRLNSIKLLMFFFRIITETYTKNSDYDIEKGIMAITSKPFRIHQIPLVIPICKREKRPVIGKFPWTMWPSGTYGLPMPVSGCPKAYGFQWQTGYYRQDTEDSDNDNNWTHANNLAGSINSDYIKQGYCIKMQRTPSKTFWPDGKYCIYKKGNCPPNMSSGEIFWDDEDKNNTNQVSGVLPDGMFKADTIIRFCCMITGDEKRTVVLPRDTPFYLFPYGSDVCQSVAGTTVQLEKIQFDLENDYNHIAGVVAFKNFHPYALISEVKRHLILHFCYYNPIPSCGAPSSVGHVEFETSNFSVGKVLQYQCERGYGNIGDHHDICLSSETWSSLKGPECIDIDECKGGHTCHVKANCYNTKGSFTCKCNPGWHGDGKDCSITKCNEPPTIENGYFVPSQVKSPLQLRPHIYLPGSSISSECNSGYLMSGCNVTSCSSSGEWQDFPMCLVVSFTWKLTKVDGFLTGLTNGIPIKLSNFSIRKVAVLGIKMLRGEADETRMDVTSIYGKQSYCEAGTFNCIRKQSNISKQLQDAYVEDVAMCCSCQPRVINDATKISLDKGTWVNTAITIICALIGFIITMALAFLLFVKMSKRDNMPRGTSMQSNASIYADINELKLDFKIDKRKGSSTSNTTESTELRITSLPPHPPPRTSVTESLSSNSRKSSLFIPPNRLHFRRRSDFGSTDMYLVPPKQFSSIFQQNHTKNPKQNEEGRSPDSTQFKLNSITKAQRRYSEFKFPTYFGSQNNSFCRPSMSVLSQVNDLGTPITECTNESEDEESPYIDVCDDCFENDTAADNSDHYRQVPKHHPVSINLRHRSHTVAEMSISGFESARQTYHTTLFRDLQRSRSLPESFMKASVDSINDSTNDFDPDIDAVFYADEIMKQEKSEKEQRQRRTGASKISLKVKLTSFTKRHHEKTDKKKVSICDLSSKLAKYKITLNKNVSMKRRCRSDTNPF